jgi:hypothetical protein
VSEDVRAAAPWPMRDDDFETFGERAADRTAAGVLETVRERRLSRRSRGSICTGDHWL